MSRKPFLRLPADFISGRKRPILGVLLLAFVGAAWAQAPVGEPWFTDYVQGNLTDWNSQLTNAKIELPSPPTSDSLYNLLVAEFGAAGTEMKHHHANAAKQLLKEAMPQLATLKSLETSARTWFISAALNSLAIHIDPWQAPFLGPKVQQEIQNAQQADPSLPEVWMMKGEISYNEPPMFGGSTEKALEYWQKARRLWQNGPSEARHTWLYLYDLADLLKALNKAGHSNQAQEIWQEMLTEAPGLASQHDRFWP